MMKLNNIRLLTARFAPMYRFYRETLGLTPNWGDENSTFASFKDANDSTALALFDRSEMLAALDLPEDPAPSAPRTNVVLVFEQESVEEFYAAKLAQGVNFLKGPQAKPDWGIRVAHLADPDGNLVEIFSNMPKESWTEELQALADQHG